MDSLLRCKSTKTIIFLPPFTAIFSPKNHPPSPVGSNFTIRSSVLGCSTNISM